TTAAPSRFWAGLSRRIRSLLIHRTRLRQGSKCASPNPVRATATDSMRSKSKAKFMRPAWVAAFLAAMLLSGCAVGPNYKRPSAQVPDTWKGEGPWQTAAPKDSIPKGTWWQVYHDAELDRLEQELMQANQSLVAARDRLWQARSLARVATAAYFPSLSANPSGQRQRVSGNRDLEGANPALVKPDTENTFAVPFSVNYEADLFGSV